LYSSANCFKICEKTLALKVGVICGTDIYEHRGNPKYRQRTVESLNSRESHGLILTPDTGGRGFNMMNL
jgi:hypothetical protein